MKKVIVALAVLTTITACSKHHVETYIDSRGEMVVAPSINKPAISERADKAASMYNTYQTFKGEGDTMSLYYKLLQKGEFKKAAKIMEGIKAVKRVETSLKIHSYKRKKDRPSRKRKRVYFDPKNM